jgi:hypothetical protein
LIERRVARQRRWDRAVSRRFYGLIPSMIE